MPTPFTSEDLGRVFNAPTLTRGRTLVLLGAVAVRLDEDVMTAAVEDPGRAPHRNPGPGVARPQRELYRGSKPAWNMFMRSFAARQAEASRAMAVMAPGWIRTALGGTDAPLAIEDTIPKLVDVLLEKRQRPGLEYLD